MARSSIYSPSMQRQIEIAAEQYFSGTGYDWLDVFYEHGQWWVKTEFTDNEEQTKTYSVVDASGFGSVDGFDFTEV